MRLPLERRRGASFPGVLAEYIGFTLAAAAVVAGRHARRGYDIVHVHSPLTPVLPLLAIEEAEVPVIGTFHTYFDRSIAYATFRRFFQRRLNMLSAAIAVSQSTIVALERYFDADWKIIPNGIDTDLFQPNVTRPSAIRRRCMDSARDS